MTETKHVEKETKSASCEGCNGCQLEETKQFLDGSEANQHVVKEVQELSAASGPSGYQIELRVSQEASQAVIAELASMVRTFAELSTAEVNHEHNKGTSDVVQNSVTADAKGISQFSFSANMLSAPMLSAQQVTSNNYSQGVEKAIINFETRAAGAQGSVNVDSQISSRSKTAFPILGQNEFKFMLSANAQTRSTSTVITQATQKNSLNENNSTSKSNAAQKDASDMKVNRSNIRVDSDKVSTLKTALKHQEFGPAHITKPKTLVSHAEKANSAVSLRHTAATRKTGFAEANFAGPKQLVRQITRPIRNILQGMQQSLITRVRNAMTMLRGADLKLTNRTRPVAKLIPRQVSKIDKIQAKNFKTVKDERQLSKNTTLELKIKSKLPVSISRRIDRLVRVVGDMISKYPEIRTALLQLRTLTQPLNRGNMPAQQQKVQQQIMRQILSEMRSKLSVRLRALLSVNQKSTSTSKASQAQSLYNRKRLQLTLRDVVRLNRSLRQLGNRTSLNSRTIRSYRLSRLSKALKMSPLRQASRRLIRTGKGPSQQVGQRLAMRKGVRQPTSKQNLRPGRSKVANRHLHDPSNKQLRGIENGVDREISVEEFKLDTASRLKLSRGLSAGTRRGANQTRSQVELLKQLKRKRTSVSAAPRVEQSGSGTSTATASKTLAQAGQALKSSKNSEQRADNRGPSKSLDVVRVRVDDDGSQKKPWDKNSLQKIAVS